MQKSKEFLDDLATLATGAMSTGIQLKSQIKEELNNHFKEFMDRQDLALKDDVVKLENMLKKSRAEIEELKLKIEQLEKKKK